MTTQNYIEHMMQPYIETVEPPNFLSSLFTVPSDGMHMAEKITVDIMTDDNDIAWPTSDDGWHANRRDDFEGREWRPAVYKEKFSITASDLMQGRSIGENPFVEPVFGSRAQKELNRLSIKLQNKINGSKELMAAQILTTGEVTMTDDNGKTRYTDTFGALDTHFPKASVAWASTTTAVPLTDIGNLGKVELADGKRTPRRVIMNDATFDSFLATDSVQASLDAEKRLWRGEFARQAVGTDSRGGTLQGYIKAGPFTLELWTYNAYYKDPQNGAQTLYLPNDRYILESGGRMEAYFGGLANFGTDGRGTRYFQRLNNPGLQNDLSVVVWTEPDGTAISIGVGTRINLIPVAVNTYGCGYTTT